MTHYVVYDVFTDTAFGGNPLAVFPDATGLDPDKLQAIAREFNFSETTFVYPPVDPSHTAKVRIFTPTMELQFAGHPIIGTAFALYELGGPADMTFDLGVGPISCRIADGLASFQTKVALETIASPAIALVARALSLPVTAIKTETHAPVQASLGLPFVITELADITALRACSPHIDAMKEGAALHPAGLDFAQFTYVRDGQKINARMFAPLDNIPEDPATGSACATLTALLAQFGIGDRFHIAQGVEMGRPSTIITEAMNSGVTVSGQAVQTMKGTFLA
jgi:trans-2,3-dihydro-3-hydroxyanthranilate isomerase